MRTRPCCAFIQPGWPPRLRAALSLLWHCRASYGDSIWSASEASRCFQQGALPEMPPSRGCGSTHGQSENPPWRLKSSDADTTTAASAILIMADVGNAIPLDAGGHLCGGRRAPPAAARHKAALQTGCVTSVSDRDELEMMSRQTPPVKSVRISKTSARPAPSSLRIVFVTVTD